MLKLFQIRNLHDSPSSRGVIQISEADYDDIAINHPPARLTYIDDEDGDQITVGSSLELSQRLDEPIAVRRVLASGHLAHYESEFMHLFDINRTNSVTDLWKQFEYSPSIGPKIEAKPAITQPSEVASPDVAPDKASASDDAIPSSAPSQENQSLLAAFEAEFGQWHSSTETSETQTRQPKPSPAVQPSTNHDSHGVPPAVEALVTQLVQYLRSGVNVVQSEVRTRMPELRRHLEEAQRDLPENLAASLQALIAQLDAKMRDFAHGHLPEHGRQMAEEALNAGRPIAESAVGGLWALSSELEQAGRTLYAAFENELRRNRPNATATEPSSAFHGVPNHMNMNQASSGPGSQATESVSVDMPSEGLAVPPSSAPQGSQSFSSSQETSSNTVNAGQYTHTGPSPHGWPHPPNQDWSYVPEQQWPPFSSTTSQRTPLAPQMPWNTAWHMPNTANVHGTGWPGSQQTHSAAPSDRPSDIPQESCRATEHESVRPGAGHNTATDTWARLDGRERWRARQALSQGADITSQHTPTRPPKTNLDQAKETEIENCITSLANMGFGGPEQGGRCRLAIYAAAANGSVYDAIELIEDEEKYYAAMD